MDIFTGKLRLAGSIQNEIPKTDMTAAEVVLLRAIHGHDSVVDLKRTGSHKMLHAEERERLITLYGEAKNPDGQFYFREMFGPEHRELPTKVLDYQDPEKLPVVENIVTDEDAASLMA